MTLNGVMTADARYLCGSKVFVTEYLELEIVHGNCDALQHMALAARRRTSRSLPITKFEGR